MIQHITPAVSGSSLCLSAEDTPSLFLAPGAPLPRLTTETGAPALCPECVVRHQVAEQPLFEHRAASVERLLSRVLLGQVIGRAHALPTLKRYQEVIQALGLPMPAPILSLMDRSRAGARDTGADRAAIG